MLLNKNQVSLLVLLLSRDQPTPIPSYHQRPIGKK